MPVVYHPLISIQKENIYNDLKIGRNITSSSVSFVIRMTSAFFCQVPGVSLLSQKAGNKRVTPAHLLGTWRHFCHIWLILHEEKITPDISSVVNAFKNPSLWWCSCLGESLWDIRSRRKEVCFWKMLFIVPLVILVWGNKGCCNENSENFYGNW